MLKVALFLLGAASGATGVASWLLSDSETFHGTLSPMRPESMRERWQALDARIHEAITEGRQAGAETEARLRQEFDVYRRGQRPATS